MSDGFSSRSEHKVDQKGRVSIPAPFRRILESGGDQGVHILPDLKGEPCIECFSSRYIRKIDAQIGRMPPFSDARRRLERVFNANREHLEMDETGRIVLPKPFRDLAGIGDRALFVGLGKTFQIWAPDAHHSHHGDDLAPEKVAEALTAMPWPDDDDDD